MLRPMDQPEDTPTRLNSGSRIIRNICLRRRLCDPLAHDRAENAILQGEYNLFIALHLGFAAWAWFISVGSVGAKFAAFALQYGIFRAIVRQRIAQSAT